VGVGDEADAKHAAHFHIAATLCGEFGKLWSSGGSTSIATGVQGSLGLRLRW